MNKGKGTVHIIYAQTRLSQLFPHLPLEERFLLLGRVNQMESALVLFVKVGVLTIALTELGRISERGQKYMVKSTRAS